MEIDINGVSIHYETENRNSTAPWITFSHALSTNMTVWDDTVDALKRDYRILRYDLRGHGKSQATPGPYDFPMLMQDVTGLWDALGVSKSHWVGLSIGGMIGYGLAISSPDRLHSLVACDSQPDAPPDYAAYFQSRIDKTRGGKGMAGLVDSTIERWFTAKSVAADPPSIKKVRQMILSTDTVGHEGCCMALQTLAFGPRLNEIRVPTLIVGGAEDKGAPPDALAKATARIPGARHVVIPDAGHIVAVENSPAFVAELKAFLNTVAA
jgi:3-oxoadipate enol-lactonase